METLHACTEHFISDTLLRHLRSHRGTGARITRGSTRDDAQQALDIVRVANDTYDTQNTHDATESQPSLSENPDGILVEHDTRQSYHDQTISPTANTTISPWETVREDEGKLTMMNHQNADIDPWLLGSNFDVGAVEWDLATTLLDWAGLPNYPSIANTTHLTTGPDLERSNHRPISPISVVQPYPGIHSQPRPYGQATVHSRPNDIVYNSGTDSGRETTVDIDEAHRQHLSRILETKVISGTLPPVNSLNLALDLYFERFHPILPIVHKATFRPSHANALLLLSMYTIGTLFIGTDNALASGKDIFDRLNKVILVSWEQHLRRSEPEGLAMVQAALLGQTYAFMYGNSHDAFMAETFHGTTLCWVRKIATTASRDQSQSAGTTQDQDLDTQWRSWCHAEQKARLMLGIRIHDAELAAMFHRCPLLRHETYTSISSPMSLETLFDAPDASSWSELRQQATDLVSDPNSSRFGHASAEHVVTTTPSTETLSDPDFAVYSNLQSTNAYILELRSTATMSETKIGEITSDLTLLFERLEHPDEATGDTRFHMLMLCHLNFMYLSGDFSLLEHAIGPDATLASVARGHLVSWITSSDSVRCMLHAVLLVEEAESVRLGQEYAVHVRRALYCAALLWTTLAHLGDRIISETQTSLVLKYQELESLGPTRCRRLIEKSAVNRTNRTKIWSSLAYRSAGLIRRFSRGKLSSTLAEKIVSALEKLDTEATT
jgi:hypothetical protein